MKLGNMHVVMSASKTDLGAEYNTERNATLERSLQDLDLPYGKAKGVFKGVEEDSFVVQCWDFEHVGWLLAVAANFEQESVLLVDARDRGYLLGTDRTLNYLGLMWASGTKIPDRDYTLLNGTYYYF